MQTLNSLASSV